ncbi:MAG: RNA polymerase sigma factor [Acidimicrobiales bacterium]
MDREPMPDFDRVLDRALAGDEGAWAHLYDSLAPQLLGYLRIRGAQDAEALVGDTFLHVARGIAGFEGTQSGFRSWVFVIASSRLLDERRRLRRKPTEPLETVVAERLSCRDDVQAEVEQMAAADAASDLLTLLTPDQRAVVALRVFGGLTSAEVAEIVDKPLSAVKALYRRGLATLRRQLVGDADEMERTWELLSAVSFSALPSVTEGS